MSTDYRWKYWRKLLTFRLWRPDIGKMQLNVSEGMSESPGCTPHSPSDGYQCILLFEEASSTESAKCPCKPEKTNHKNNILKTASMFKKKSHLVISIWRSLFPDLNLVRSWVVVVQKRFHFSLKFMQLLLFHLQGTHQFLLHKEKF